MPSPILEAGARTCVRWPCTCCLLNVAVIVLLSVVAFATGLMTPMRLEKDWMVADASATQWLNAWNLAQEMNSEPSRKQMAGEEVNVEDGEEDYGGWQLRLLYKAEERDGVGNLFQPAMLKQICELERLVSAESSKKVEVIFSPVATLFYGYSVSPESAEADVEAVTTKQFYGYPTMDESTGESAGNSSSGQPCPLLNEAFVQKKVAAVLEDVREKGTNSRFGLLVHPTFVKTGRTPTSSSAMVVKKTLAEADSDMEENSESVRRLLESFDPPLAKGFLRSAYQVGDKDKFVSWGDSGLRVRIVYMGADEDFVDQDFSMAFGAIIMVFILIWWHTDSLFIASISILAIMLSLPLANIVYRGIFQVGYFSYINILVVYLILGIGADDIFVLVDTWRHVTEPLRARLDEEEVRIFAITKTWVSVAHTLFNTSFTTTVAFLSCSVSSLMPMRTAGWYAATAICINYLLCLTLGTSALLVNHRYFEHRRSVCTLFSDCVALGCAKARSRMEPAADEAVAQKSTTKKVPLFERILINGYLPLMKKKPVAVGLLLLMLGTVAQGVYFTSQLTPPRVREVWLPGNHMSVGFDEYEVANFYASNDEKYADLVFYWGVGSLDMSDFDVYNPDAHLGRPRWDPDFDVSSSESQAALLRFCDLMRKVECRDPLGSPLEGCRNGKDAHTLMLQVERRTDRCFMEDVLPWLQQQNANASVPTGNGFIDVLRDFRRDAQEPVTVVDGGYWEDIMFVDDKLRTVAVRMRIAMQSREPYMSGVKVRDLVDTWLAKMVAEMPAGLRSLKYAIRTFASYDLGREVLSGLFAGCGIAAPMTFLVLLISTRNIIVAFLAVFSVASVVLCVLGFCKSALDWDLGIAEGIAGVIVIGYSVDYVIHLAHFYCHACAQGIEDRTGRAEHAVRNMGATVIAGAITTAGSGVLMFSCYLRFFNKMALLISMTIFYSSLFSMGLFMSLLFVLGPEGNFGFLPYCIPVRPDSNQVLEIEGKSSAVVKPCAEDSSAVKVTASNPSNTSTDTGANSSAPRERGENNESS